MDAIGICLLALAWIALMGVVVALCAAAGRADRRERRLPRRLPG
jgi:hypothetical protein